MTRNQYIFSHYTFVKISSNLLPNQIRVIIVFDKKFIKCISTH